MKSSLKASEIIALTGVSSPFDDLCDQAGIPEEQREDLFMRLVKSGQTPGELRYTSRESAQKIIDNTVRKVHDKVLDFKKSQGALKST